jgi:5-methyltetrahydrofolate--homocysteine methyltransferase
MSAWLHFSGKDWERIERDWSAWWAGELERPLVMIENQVPHPEAFLLDLEPWEEIPASSFPLEWPVEAVLDYYEKRLEGRRFYGDAFPKWWPNFGPGIVAGFLGAQVHCAVDTVWFEPAQGGSISGLQLTYDATNPWWRRVQELTRAATERWGSQVAVGQTDLGGNLDILASLRATQQLLYDLYDAPDEVARLSAGITRLWLRYYDELHALIQAAGRGTSCWAPIWSPGRCYMLQSDFAYMISPPMFERFVLPDLSVCCEHLEHAFYHLDGRGQIYHLDLLLDLEKLRGIQWIPGDGQPPAEEWLPLLARIRGRSRHSGRNGGGGRGKLCQLSVSPEGALTIVRELGGRGFALYIQQAMDEGEAERFLHTLNESWKG